MKSPGLIHFSLTLILASNSKAITIIPSTASETSTTTTTQRTPTATYTVIYVPVVALVILVFSVGIFFFIKHKRSKSFTREESGIYANVGSASSNQVKREASCAKQDKKKLASKAIDEPVYINLRASPVPMDQGMHHTDSIYANIDC